ncbi:hypothetical protein T07_1280 [Trichinella nelsoni]|uniref:Uncharacterized protein n=1 Tax=Trichinella nelsoni TaxID=6336 RepID=A0A0V0RJV8_9BILA|nr:hypothetical protein T07_1280 [Trichinella nelsoni]
MFLHILNSSFLSTFAACANVKFQRILATSIHTDPRCLIILRNCLKAARDITDREMIFIIYFMHYMLVYILRDFYAALDCASMKADILHFQTRPDQAPGIAGP